MCREHLARVGSLIPIVVIGTRMALPALCYFASVIRMLEAAAADVYLPFIIFNALSLYTFLRIPSSRPKPYNGQW
jgi:hypothetical protein